MSNIEKIKKAIKEVLNERTTREITVISPVDWGTKLSFSKKTRYPMLSDVAWELKRLSLKEAHPDADVLREDEYKIVLLVDKVKEKEKDD
jgi:hypothetical protein